MENKIKVLHILNTNTFSGAENVAITIINNYPESICGYYMAMKGPIREYLKQYDISNILFEKINVASIRTAVRKIHPDIIQAHDYTTSILAIAANTRVPVISHLHNNSPWLKKYGPKSFAYCWAAEHAKRILAVSDSIMDEYVFGSRFTEKTVVMGNPIDFNRIRRLAGTQETEKIYDLVFLGRETPQKNPLLFLQIIQNLALNNKDIRAVMVGSGEMHDQVTEWIHELHLDNNVIQVGNQRNPYTFVKQSKVMCMPSKWEGFGLAAVEGLSLGVPVVCSGAGGLKNIVDESCGKICGDDISIYADEIEKLLKDMHYYRGKSVAAVAQSEKFDTLNEYMGKLQNIYREI